MGPTELFLWPKICFHKDQLSDGKKEALFEKFEILSYLRYFTLGQTVTTVTVEFGTTS